MNSLSLAPLIGAICNFALSIFVLTSDRKSRLSQVYFFWGLCITTWNLCTFFLFLLDGDPANKPQAFFWATILQYGVIFLPIASLHLSVLIAQVRAGRIIAALYVLHFGLAIMHSQGLFISDVHHVGYAWYSVAGVGFWIYACAYLQSTAAIFMLLKSRSRLPPIRRKRLDALIIAQTLIVVLGSNDILPILGIEKYPILNTPIYPIGSIAAVFYGIIVGYSVLQHQLLDVHIALGRRTAHFVRFIFLFLIGLILQIMITACAPMEFTFLSFSSSLAVLMLSTLIGTILFPRLLGGIGERLDSGLRGDRFESGDRVRGFIESMIWYEDLEALLDDLHDILVRTLSITSYSIILRDESQHAFTIHRAHPGEAGRQVEDLKVNSPVFQYFEWEKAEYLAIDAKYLRPGVRSVERLARKQLVAFAAEFCFPLTFQNEPFGLFLVGAKKDGDTYSGTDITLLVALVKNLSLMVNQLRLKDQLRQNQELDLLGRMSRGMAHDLNNLLTPVSTLLQLSAEVGPDSTLNEELLPVALRNVKTMRAYIKEALFFSEHLRPDIQVDRLDLLLKHAADLAIASRDKQVEIVVAAPDEVSIEMDDVLLQRLFANLIANAIDASPPQSTIQVRLEQLAKTEVQRDWLRIRVIDQGEGISKENLGRVLTPYFTTKNKGDENRGFGLGLAICRKIVNLHGGNLSIASQLKKGTTVQVDLPSRQITQTMPTILPLA